MQTGIASIGDSDGLRRAGGPSILVAKAQAGRIEADRRAHADGGATDPDSLWAASAVVGKVERGGAVTNRGRTERHTDATGAIRRDRRSSAGVRANSEVGGVIAGEADSGDMDRRGTRIGQRHALGGTGRANSLTAEHEIGRVEGNRGTTAANGAIVM